MDGQIEALRRLSRLRPEILQLALHMQDKLEERAPKHDNEERWHETPPTALADRCGDEVRELSDAVIEWYTGAVKAVVVAREAADVGNFAWMTADRCGMNSNEARGIISALRELVDRVAAPA